MSVGTVYYSYKYYHENITTRHSVKPYIGMTKLNNTQSFDLNLIKVPYNHKRNTAKRDIAHNQVTRKVIK